MITEYEQMIVSAMDCPHCHAEASHEVTKKETKEAKTKTFNIETTLVTLFTKCAVCDFEFHIGYDRRKVF